MKLIIPASTEADIAKSIDIRYEVFTKEQNVPQSIDVDENDVPGGNCLHFLIYEDEKAIGTFRISINQNMVARLQRFCVLPEYRGKGYGKYAMEFVEGFCSGQKVKKIVFDAQIQMVDFYKSLGYKVFSDEFVEAGIIHVKMSKKIEE